MGNAYLSIVEEELAKGQSVLDNVQKTVDEFLKDMPFVDGMNGVYPIPLAQNAITSIEEAIEQLKVLRAFIKDMKETYIKEGNGNE